MSDKARSAPERIRDCGDLVVVAATTAAFFLAIIDYLWPGKGINGTSGALLVIVSTILILGAALVFSFRPDGRSTLMTALGSFIVLGIVGTAFVAWLLEAGLLLMLMVIALLGALTSLAIPQTKGGRPGPRTGNPPPSPAAAKPFSRRRQSPGSAPVPAPTRIAGPGTEDTTATGTTLGQPSRLRRFVRTSWVNAN